MELLGVFFASHEPHELDRMRPSGILGNVILIRIVRDNITLNIPRTPQLFGREGDRPTRCPTPRVQLIARAAWGGGSGMPNGSGGNSVWVSYFRSAMLGKRLSVEEGTFV